MSESWWSQWQQETHTMLHPDILPDTMDLSVKVPPPLQAIFHEQAKSIIAIKVSNTLLVTDEEERWSDDQMIVIQWGAMSVNCEVN